MIHESAQWNHSLVRDLFSVDEATLSVWNRLLISWPGTYNAIDIVSWLGYLCHATNGDGLVLILTAIWAIWWARNWHYHEGFGSTPTELVYFIRFYLGGLSVL
ncbi:hypothetical protein PVK06_041168 [Gossypium arboreum]|uniref:Uncharacterized protein n=1 Tax=Gossypium arboreum TaxID=29729 RepID=A0ABR0N7S9_GOSAR|nr:hypothetical protein PVK06_041168 [Gossypium arboreum]